MKDYVNAKILYCHPPPDISELAFNQRTHELAMLRFADKKRAPVTRVGKGADTFVPSDVLSTSTAGETVVQAQGLKSRTIDQNFFENNSTLSPRPFIQGSGLDGQTFSRLRVYPHQNAVADDGTAIGGRRARLASVLLNQGGVVGDGKKHHKKMKRVKQRSGKGYDI
jgi:large subunit GTPase 1